MLIIALVMAQPITNSVDTTQKGIRIVFIVKATDSDFWQVVLSGARSAEKELGVTVVTRHRLRKQISINKLPFSRMQSQQNQMQL
jgi:ABC-type sugar transport system substrate-binding protein